MTGVSQLSGRIMDMNAERLGVDKYEVSWHVGARPDHAAWQGKVYTKKQLVDICGLGTGPGLLGWNCRHEYYLFFPDSERLYSDEWLVKQNKREAQKKAFRGREYNTYEAIQKQRRMETNMRAQREKVAFMQEGEADPDDIMIERCKYQAQLDEYKEFSRAFGMLEQRERIYYDLNGRVAPTPKQYEKHKYDETIIREIHKGGVRGKVHITPTKVNLAKITYDAEHINDRSHNVTEELAHEIIRTASVSVTAWKGQFEKYYSPIVNGVAYVNMDKNEIRTAFTGDEIKGDAKAAMEVLKKYGK